MSLTRFLIVTGLSGAGKSETLNYLEDQGFYCVDNLPTSLVSKFAELCLQEGSDLHRVALGIDIRDRNFLPHFFGELDGLETENMHPEVVFLEASDEVLLQRFSETRRKHPLSAETSVIDGIREERKLLEPVKAKADWILDSSDANVRQLRQKLHETLLSEDGRRGLSLSIMSFGYKYGVPPEVDLLFDVRFLPNPYYSREFRPLTGNDDQVKDYVLGSPVARDFLERISNLCTFLLPHYENEGKTYLTIGVGCTGGRHRSVVIANALRDFFQEQNLNIRIHHRDADR